MRKLHLRDGSFGCRHCHRLTYRSTQESDRRVYAAARAGVDADHLLDSPWSTLSERVFGMKHFTVYWKRRERLAKRLKRDRRPGPSESAGS